MVTSYAGLMGWNGSSGYNGNSCLGGDEYAPWLARACAGIAGRT
jgi:hypothetical protein